MPDRRRHRGPHPKDPELFAPRHWPTLRRAVADLSWLLGRGYSEKAALKLVGDRYRLNERQRTAVSRCACDDEARRDRLARELTAEEVAGQPLAIDGYNPLTTVESMLGGGVLLRARDGCRRWFNLADRLARSAEAEGVNPVDLSLDTGPPEQEPDEQSGN